MCLSNPQILYCILGINYLEFHGMIDKEVAMSIARNLLSEYGMLLDSDYHEIHDFDPDDVYKDSLKLDPKSGWPINDK